MTRYLIRRNIMSDVIFNTVIFTDGQNNFPKPVEFAEKQLDSFLGNDDRWKEIGVRVGTKNKIYYDAETICTDDAWIICSGPIPVSEEKLREIVQRERLSIWKPRTVIELIEFMFD
jgi:hypothetical protein